MKRVLTLLVAMMLVFGLLPVSVQAKVLDNGLEYVVYRDHVEITGYTGDDTKVVIPNEIEGMPVTIIGNDAFYRCTNLTSISIPAGVMELHSRAFYCCENLTDISVPDSVTYIGSRAFYGCAKLFNITLPDRVTFIGEHAFSGCSQLTSIAIPNGVTSIGDYAFFRCFKLASISVPGSVTTIGDYAFFECYALSSISIPESVISIGDYAFYSCHNLTNLPLPDSVTSLGENAYADCDGLCSIIIPSSITTIPLGAFSGCSNLVSVSIANGITSIGRGAFRNCDSLVGISIPSSVASIGSYSFYNCSSMTNISIPYSVNTIGDSAFGSCSVLSSITFKGNAPSLGENVFSGITATAYYFTGNITWTEDIMQNYGGNITWLGLDHSHEYNSITVSPTCTEQGYTTYTCSCGDSYVSDCLDALGHDMGEWETVIAPTCTEDGSESRSCFRCEYTETQSIVAVGHSYIGTITAPTCTERGYTTYTCSCGDTYVSDEVPALGHTEETIPAVAATCIETGLTEGKKCSACGEILVAQEVVPAMGHDWNGTCCQRCDATRENPFNDVADGSFYIDPVLWAVENGITNGATATTFNPNGTCLRAHVVTFLHRAAGNPAPASNKNPFNDVKSIDFFYQPVLWAVEKGITNGTSATTFGSYANCNRAAVVTFLWRAAGSPEPKSTNNPFVDVKATDFFYKPVLWAVEKGITNGVDTTHFGPGTDCNRAQVVTFLYRAYN